MYCLGLLGSSDDRKEIAHLYFPFFRCVCPGSPIVRAGRSRRRLTFIQEDDNYYLEMRRRHFIYVRVCTKEPSRRHEVNAIVRARRKVKECIRGRERECICSREGEREREKHERCPSNILPYLKRKSL